MTCVCMTTISLFTVLCLITCHNWLPLPPPSSSSVFSWKWHVSWWFEPFEGRYSVSLVSPIYIGDIHVINPPLLICLLLGCVSTKSLWGYRAINFFPLHLLCSFGSWPLLTALMSSPSLWLLIKFSQWEVPRGSWRVGKRRDWDLYSRLLMGVFWNSICISTKYLSSCLVALFWSSL